MRDPSVGIRHGDETSESGATRTETAMAERDGGGMFLNCSYCGLSIQMRFQSMQMEHCPRCLARARLLQPLLRSPQPLKALQGEGYHRRPRADRGSRPGFDAR